MRSHSILATIAALPTLVLSAATPPSYGYALTNSSTEHQCVSSTHDTSGTGIVTVPSSVPVFTFNELYDMTTHFFDQFVYPNNVIQAKSINSTLWAEDVVGRVDATRNFNGRELNTEYAFGLFSQIALNPGAFTLLGMPMSYVITHFVGNQNIISASLIVNFNVTALNVVTPVEIDFWATFNKHKQISQYDASFRYLQWQFQTLYDIGMEIFHLNTTHQVQKATAPLLAESICKTAQTYCNGTNTQYTSEQACQDFLTNDVPFGQAYQLGMNTLLCRMVHQNMVPSRPDVHCMHVGPTGGEYCTNDRTYAGTVTETLYRQPFVPYGYASENKAVDGM